LSPLPRQDSLNRVSGFVPADLFAKGLDKLQAASGRTLIRTIIRSSLDESLAAVLDSNEENPAIRPISVAEEALERGGVETQYARPFDHTTFLQRFKSAETAVELTYRIQATPWKAFQPGVQWIMSPASDAAIDDALLIGVRLDLSL